MLDLLERYLNRELGIDLITGPSALDLPRYLYSYYQWFQANVGESQVLLVVPRLPAQELQPGEKIGHLQLMEKEGSLPVLWCADKMTAYERRSFNQQRIAYVIPGKQLNAPLLGLLASRAAQSSRMLREVLSPSAQAVLLWCLLKKRFSSVDSTSIGAATGYSRITVNRVMHEIEMLLPELVSVSEGGRKCIKIEYAKGVWMKAKSYLASPVKKRCQIRRTEIELSGKEDWGSSFKMGDERQKAGLWPEGLLLAGESALAVETALVDPGKPSWAVSTERYKIWSKKRCWCEVAYAEQATDVIEVWSYDPLLLSSTSTVDTLSLILSMRKEAETDPRIESAIENLEEWLAW